MVTDFRNNESWRRRNFKERSGVMLHQGLFCILSPLSALSWVSELFWPRKLFCRGNSQLFLKVYCIIREIKLDVTWSYVKRQTAKLKLLPSVFSPLNSRVKIFVFVENSTRHFSIFMWFNEGLEEKNSNSEVIFAVCRLTLRNVKLNLSILATYKITLKLKETVY